MVNKKESNKNKKRPAEIFGVKPFRWKSSADTASIATIGLSIYYASGTKSEWQPLLAHCLDYYSSLQRRVFMFLCVGQCGDTLEEGQNDGVQMGESTSFSLCCILYASHLTNRHTSCVPHSQLVRKTVKKKMRKVYRTLNMDAITEEE